MRSTKLLACLAMGAAAFALSCARGVEPDPEGTSEPGAASASTEEPTGAEETEEADAEEDAGAEEAAGTGDDGVEEDEDRARGPGDLARDAEVKEWSDAGRTDAQQVVETDAGGALDAAAIVDGGVRAASENDAALAPATELDARTEQDAGASRSEDASTPATPAESEPSPAASGETSAPTAPADETQEPVPAPIDEPVAPPESASNTCSNFSDCAQQPCFPLGLLACCRADGSCGCSWAPGAYCL